MPDTALLLIDIINDQFQHPILRTKRPQLTLSINKLIASAREHHVPIIWIRNEFAADLSDAFPEIRKKGIATCIRGTKGCEFLPELDVQPNDKVLAKTRYSAFFGTDLDDFLHRSNVSRIVLAGVNTHACVRMTAIDAYQRDYEVVLATGCVESYDPEHHEVTLRYLKDKITVVQSIEDIFRDENLSTRR